jgi:hypothetical protein
MKSGRNLVATLSLLAILTASPAAADWEIPGGDAGPLGIAGEELLVAAQWGFQILQVAL